MKRLSALGLVARPSVKRLRWGWALGVALGMLAGARAGELPAPVEREVDFARDVQPILTRHCLECHGGARQKSGYRVDVREIALRGGESGQAAVVRGKSAESPLILRVAGVNAEEAMPPKGERLSAEQVGILRAWIDRGAVWPDALSQAGPKTDHWAFRAPVKPPVPPVRATRWVRNPIDAFILARLEREGLKPSPEADPVTRLRRLSLDLVGLPPSPEAVDAFVKDRSAGAWTREVERLLKSPHYGERWGRHWLDAARYADSDGFEKDKPRQIWAYRDYVIGAFNRDLPYDQFVVEQLAGDLLPGATPDQVVATGFLRNSMLNEEGGVDPEQFRMDAMFDRMDCIGKSILGLTIQCAQCHTHKYDPITQEEYYRVFAFLNNDHEAERPVYSPEQWQEIAAIRRGIGEIEEELRHRAAGWEERMAAWEAAVRTNQPAWTVLEVENASDNSQRYFRQADGSILAQGYAPTKFTTLMRTTNALTGITAFRLELLNDPNLPLGGPGRSPKGLMGLTEFKVEVADPEHPTNKAWVKIVRATADFGNAEKELEKMHDDRSGKRRVTGPVEFAIDDKDETAWGIDAGPGRRNVPRRAVFVAEQPVGFPKGAILTFHLRQNHGGWNSDDNQNNNLGRFRLSATTASEAVADPLPASVRAALDIPRDRRTREQAALVFGHWRTTVPEWREANERIEALWRRHPEGGSTLALVARGEDDGRSTRVLKRGDWLKPDREVRPGVPAVLHPLPAGADGSRLTFARWLVDRRSPTAARVFVNRVWQAYFGTGLLETPEDFGVRAPEVSHPELLDWLACEFMDRGWSVKELHRLIVNSATYAQSSRVTPELAEKDPQNRLLARGSRLRVEAEVVRDIALAASGLLNAKVGGPSVMPPAPSFLFQPPASYGPKVWEEAGGGEKYRRALYTFRYRSVPYPMLQAFDAPNGDFSCVRRLRSNTPLQALTSLNEELFMECARALATQALAEGGATDAERVTYAFRRCVGRKPTGGELQELLGLLRRQQQRVADGYVSAGELGQGGVTTPAPAPKGGNPTQLAALTVVSRVLLNLDETITRE